MVYYHCWYNNKHTYDKFKAKIDFGIGTFEEYKYATEKEKAKLFQAIEDNGYYWNKETKTLEKLVKPKFKYEDIKLSTIGYKWNKATKSLEKLPKFKIGNRIVKKGNISNPVSIIRVGSRDYYCYSDTEHDIEVLPIAEQDNWELVPDKFNISELKPFDKVLVRSDNSNIWECDFFSSYNPKCSNRFHCVGAWYNICIHFAFGGFVG